jgi:hypothetical protein
MGLGSVAGSNDTGLGLLTIFEVGLGLFTGPSAGPDMGACPNPLVSSEAKSSGVKA